MYVGDRDTYDDVFCQDCGNIADRETLNDTGLCEYCFFPNINSAHMAYHANRVLEDLGMETLVVDFWGGLWEGRGDISAVPKYLA